MTTGAPPAPIGLATFEPWHDPEIDRCGVPVDGGYSRIAWLPVLGTTTWLVWGAVAGRLQGAGPMSCPLSELAPPHAPGPAAATRALGRREAFGLADRHPAGACLVRWSCPPLWDRLLARAPSPVHAAHRVTFLPSRRRSRRQGRSR